MKETIIIIGKDRSKSNITFSEYVEYMIERLGGNHGKHLHSTTSSGVSSDIKKQDVRLGEEREDTSHPDRSQQENKRE